MARALAVEPTTLLPEQRELLRRLHHVEMLSLGEDPVPFARETSYALGAKMERGRYYAIPTTLGPIFAKRARNKGLYPLPCILKSDSSSLAELVQDWKMEMCPDGDDAEACSAIVSHAFRVFPSLLPTYIAARTFAPEAQTAAVFQFGTLGTNPEETGYVRIEPLLPEPESADLFKPDRLVCRFQYLNHALWYWFDIADFVALASPTDLVALPDTDGTGYVTLNSTVSTLIRLRGFRDDVRDAIMRTFRAGELEFDPQSFTVFTGIGGEGCTCGEAASDDDESADETP
jgi:hypothetical protein